MDRETLALEHPLSNLRLQQLGCSFVNWGEAFQEGS